MNIATTSTISTTLTVEEPPAPKLQCSVIGETYYDECGACFSNDPFDCNGDCPNDSGVAVHVRDCFGICVPSGNATTYDVCGICGGNGLGCIDCNGTINGTLVLDGCGVCGGSQTLDGCGVCGGDSSSCYGLNEVSPAFVPNIVGRKLSLKGAGFNESDQIYVDGQILPRSSRISVDPSEHVIEWPNTKLKFGSALTFEIRIRVESVTKGQSAAVILTVYNQDEMGVKSVEYDKLYVLARSETVYLEGKNYINMSTASCIYSLSPALATPATFLNDTFYSCQSPRLSYSAKVPVHLTYNTIDDTFILQNLAFDVQALHYFERAPTIKNARFSDDGASISLFFNEPTDGDTSKPHPCMNYLITNPGISSDTATLANSPNDCHVRFKKPDEMVIEVMGSFIRDNPSVAPIPGKYLELKNGTIGKINSLFSDTAAGSIKVLEPMSAVTPLVILDGSNEIGTCTNFQLSLSRSTYSGGRKFSIIHFDFSTTPALSDPPYSNILSYLQNSTDEMKQTGFLELSVPKDILPVGYTYSFTVTLGNFLGKNATARHTLKKTLSNLVPVLTFGGDRTFARNVAGKILAIMDPLPPGCASDVISEFKWSIIQYPSNNAYQIPAGFYSSTIYFPPFALSVGQYTFRLVLTLKSGGDEQTYDYTHSFRVLYAPIAVSIEGGGQRKISLDGKINLIAQVSDQTYQVWEQMNENYSYNWACFIGLSTTPCDGGDGEPLIIPSNRTLEYEAKDFGVGLFRFIVLAQNVHSKYFDQYSTIYEIVADRVPLMAIQPNRLGKIGTRFQLVLEAIVDASSLVPGTRKRDVRYNWSSEISCGGTSFASVPLNSTTLQTKPDSRVIKFQKSVLQPGASYCFKIEATDPQNLNNTGESFYTIEMKNIPSSGHCFVVGTNYGTAYEDTFTISCSGWVTDSTSYPLRYRFLILDKNGEKIPIGPATESATYSFKSGPGNFTYYVEVIDADDSTDGQEYNFEYIVVLGNTTATKFIEDQLDSFEETKNPDTGFALLSQGTQAFDFEGLGDTASGIALKTVVDTYDDLLATQLKLLNFIESLMQIVYISAQDTGPLTITILRKLAPESLSINEGEAQRTLVRSLTYVSEKMNADGLTSGTCFSENVATELLRILEPMLKSLNSSDHETGSRIISDAIEDISNTLEACLQRTKACGEPFFETNTDNINVTIGVSPTANQNGKTSLCRFELDDLANVLNYDDDACVRFKCGNMANVYRSNLTGIIDSETFSLTIRDTEESVISPDYSDTESTTENGIRFSMPVSADHVATMLASNVTLAPICVWYDASTQMFNSSGCKTLGYTDTSVDCLCSHLTEFAVGVIEPFVPGEPEMPLNERSTELLITFISALTFSIVVVIAVAVYRHRLAIRKQPSNNNLANEAPSSSNEAQPNLYNPETRARANLERLQGKEHTMEHDRRGKASAPPYEEPPSYDWHMKNGILSVVNHRQISEHVHERKTKMQLRVEFVVKILVIFLLISIIPLFDIWAYFRVFNLDSFLQATTFGAANVIIEVFAEFYLSYKMFPNAFKENWKIWASFAISLIQRVIFSLLARSIAAPSATNTSSRTTPFIQGVLNLISYVAQSTFILPMLVRWSLDSEDKVDAHAPRETSDPSPTVRHQAPHTPAAQTKTWNPRHTKAHLVLLPWVLGFGTMLTLYTYLDLGFVRASDPIVSVTNTTVIDRVANVSDTSIIERTTIVFEQSPYDWGLLAAYWVPFCAMMGLMGLEKKKVTPGTTYGGSVTHLAVYLWVIKTLPFSVGTLLNLITTPELAFLVQYGFIALFLGLDLIMMHCLTVVDDVKEPDVHHAFPLFFFEYFFSQLFFIDVDLNDVYFFVLLGLQSIWLTFKNSGIVDDLSQHAIRKMKQYAKMKLLEDDVPQDKIKTHQLQVRIALQFFLADMFSMLLVPLLNIVNLVMMEDYDPGIVDDLATFGFKLDTSFAMQQVRPSIQSRIQVLFLRYIVIAMVKLPFHLLAIYLIYWRHNRLNTQLREQDRQTLRLFETFSDHLRHGWWAYLVVMCMLVMMQATGTMSALVSTQLFRSTGSRSAVNVTSNDWTMIGTMNTTLLRGTETQLNFTDPFFLLVTPRWFTA